MKITLIQGSPHKQGSSNILAEQFQTGAEKAGHEVFVFDAAHARIAPSIVNFLGIQDAGMVLAAGCGTPEQTKKSDFPKLAYELGLFQREAVGKEIHHDVSALRAGTGRKRGKAVRTGKTA